MMGDEVWRKCHGFDVCVSAEGRVLRAVRLDANGGAVPAAPYRWDRALRSWVNSTGCRLATLRAGMSRGTYEIR